MHQLVIQSIYITIFFYILNNATFITYDCLDYSGFTPEINDETDSTRHESGQGQQAVHLLPLPGLSASFPVLQFLHFSLGRPVTMNRHLGVKEVHFYQMYLMSSVKCTKYTYTQKQTFGLAAYHMSK